MATRRGTTQLRLAKQEAAPQGTIADVGAPDADMPSRVGGIEVSAAIVLGQTVLLLRDLAALGAGTVVTLDRALGEPVDLMVNGSPFARGEMVVVGDRLGLRITELP